MELQYLKDYQDNKLKIGELRSYDIEGCSIGEIVFD